MSDERGGKQKIPRPENWTMGGSSPWSQMETPQISLDSIQKNFSNTNPNLEQAHTHERLSSVMIPLYEMKDQVWMILTRRSETMRFHTSEVSFPGGNQEPQDTDAWETALREAHEEIGLDPSLPSKIGHLDSFITVGSKSFVTPFVAVLDSPPKLEANPIEVEKILHVPLSELLSPDVYREEIWVLRDGKERNINFFELVGDTVWGATGTMIRQFLTTTLEIDDPTGTP
ncbi:MAG: CoA pyrophosphatase [Acidimicrobiales bacterium]|jgi:8-oxo-dGTP pyrophosphatase MutT (NUDIX family)|nr:CoA pyrophosphatase [Acidimicrobiales bacterium]MDP6299349.1 CoA pyrophosphatase [Acidimicrobiales bacterium]HJM28701.1 CoA pyrophosphatase [Acidimicrobiales bacterium]HJM97497.1 CoA pyrophosphatase [Acidimicrobiales bacterium]